ncbi:putative disease resistance protein RGA3 isoform X2 [Triticum aestivum]|nr:putative disease resistance protein RGA3 isoform X2 [Triticum aestivum]
MTSNLQEALVLEHLDDRYVIAQSTGATDPRETSSCPTKPKVYGRDQDRDLVISKLTSKESAAEKNLSVLAIIGYGGIGKTTLANVVFNDSAVSNHFDARLWVYVSGYFDQAKIMHRMLESLTGDDRHENIKGLKELQGTLESALKSKRVLLVLDDMWEDRQQQKWDELLTPLLSSDVPGNKILVTTRKPSVAKLIKATDQISLNGINEDDFWDFFKECAFGDENYKVEPRLKKIGKDILVQLKGNPLAAKSVAKLLRKNHTVDFWRRILKDSEWKQQADDYDIMPALMISYKYLPVHLQRCFSYCAVFPKYYKYEKECLVNMWIAQGLICSTDNMHKRTEDIGIEFFSDLVEWGFLQKEFELMTTHIMHDLIHDLAQKVSSHETFTIGDTESRKAPQLVRHVSIIAEWVYKTEIDGTVHPNETFLRGFFKSFGELQQTSSNLSTLLLFGPHDFEFAHSFRQEFTEVKSVRVLKLDMVLSDLDLMIGNISSFINLRYLELGCFYKGPRLELPEAICVLYHLEVLDIKKNWGNSTVLPRDMNKFVKLRHFIARDELHAKIAGVGEMVSLQELKAFDVRKASEFSIMQFRRLNQLRGSIRICNLGDVGSKDEAINARISEKVHLTGLHLSWNTVSEDRVHTESNVDILEDLKPHAGLIDLGIIAYRHPVPSWLSNNIHLTSLRSLHLDSCSYWKTIPTPHQLPLLRELRLSNMVRVSKIEIGCLEILELHTLHRLTQCIVLDKEQLSVNLRVLEIDDCIRLKEFPLLSISKDTLISDCQFTHLHRLWVRGCFVHMSISQLLHMDSLLYIDLFLRPSLEQFRLVPIGQSDGLRMEIKGTAEVKSKDEKLFPFNKLRDLEELEITDYPGLMCLPWEGLQKLASLKKFKMSNFGKLFSCISGLYLPPSVQELEFNRCNITMKQLSHVLLSLPLLKKFSLTSCEEVTSLPIGLFTDEHNQTVEGSWHIPPSFLATLESLEISFRMRAHAKESSVMQFWSKQCLGKFTSLKKVVIEYCPALLSTVISGGMSHIPPSSLATLRVDCITDRRLQLSELSSLTDLHVIDCSSLTCVNLDGCTALRELYISGCGMLSSLEGMQSCEALRQFSIYDCKALRSLRVSLGSLATLSIESNPNLAYVDLNSCTALQKLCIKGCATTASWDGLKSLGALGDLKVENSPGFTRSWQLASAEVESKHSSYFPRRLQVLDIDDIGVLCVPICSQLTSLKTLTIHGSIYCRRDYGDALTDDHERALLLVTSLRDLEFDQFKHLRSLPAGLECLTTLQRLTVSRCELITSLPAGGIPASLRDMEIHGCSEELTAQCRAMCRDRKIYFGVGAYTVGSIETD